MAEWLQVKSIEMLVSKSEFVLEINKDCDLLFFSCDLLNIARGRCELIIRKKNSEQKNQILISTKKPVMEADISLSDKKFENILNCINKFSNTINKRYKIILYLNKPLAVNNHGFLSLEENTTLNIVNLKLILPII